MKPLVLLIVFFFILLSPPLLAQEKQVVVPWYNLHQARLTDEAGRHRESPPNFFWHNV